ncbi:MAG: right-handed parallel beta-helix repeat-containing protein, partial [Verrucomicrobia bacterium]|nr:right-handed parallel beta-helix repeat-containing protein [Verrucomicrobiota bacterium]
GQRDGVLVWMNNTAHIEVRNCHLKNSGRTGIMMIGQNTGNLVAGCWIEHMGLNGVSLCNRFPATLDRCEQNRIHNTRISHVGELHCYAECVTIFNVSSNEVDHCELENSVRYAITVRGNTGAQYGPPVTTSLPPAKGNRFHHIRISRCGQDSGDMGALHTAGLNNPGGGSVNTFEQIVVTDTRAIASMKDWPPDGIFIDWPKMSMDQIFRDIQILRPQGKQLRSNGKDNEASAQTENVSWQPDFREDRMDYKNIGLTAEFPAEYGLRPQTVSDMALRWQRPAGGPRHSDVCFSIRWMRKNVDPFEKIAAFHGTRFDWVYATKEFIAQCAQRGYPICHCTAPMRQDRGPGEGSAAATYKIGRAEDIRGQPLIASWQNWNPPWGCYSNPDFFRLMEQDVIFAIESGATYMHVDDPDTQQMLRWGGDPKDKETRGCFCGHCLGNFRAYLAALPAEELKTFGVGDPSTFDYKQFILDGKRSVALRKHYERSYEKTIRSFLERLRASAHKKAGRYFPFACNNGSFTHWEAPIDLFDFAVGELSKYDPPTPVSIWKKAVNITRMNKAQVFTLRSNDTQENQKILCLSYCLGMNFVAPWDVWLGGSERLYGEPQDYNHFFAFVRNNARWLDGYEYAAAAGKGVRDDWYGEQPPVALAGNEDAYAFVRAVPGGSDKPVVIHLYDWGKDPKPFRVTLDNARFFPGKRLACRLLTPVQQSAAEHALGEKTKDFSKFTRSAELPCGGDDRQTTVEIPVLDPWAMLVVSPTKQGSP